MAGHLSSWQSAGERSTEGAWAILAWGDAAFMWVAAILILFVACIIPADRGVPLAFVALAVAFFGSAWVALWYSGVP